ncbi:hypothetical protein CWE09_13135 [Aliidiomarina minuta]|uniref:Spore coat protein U domain-containing protein n=1 Tax=Aliidiomarina minuta TaxID=880057 RepID=A0A432W424_9GAMM|nr:hypothetical protein CWE09_13135 [Aliidiomarina minuta]
MKHIRARLMAAFKTVFSLGILIFVPPSLAQDSRVERQTLSFSGIIEPNCRLGVNASHPAARPMNLALRANAPPQIVAAIQLHCNAAQRSTMVTYHSQNGGLRNSTGTVIDYLTDLTGIQGGSLASAGPWVVEQRAVPRVNFLRVRPQGSGIEPVGEYSDTIIISVASH